MKELSARSLLSDSARTGLMWQVAILAGPLVLQNLSHTLLGVIDTYFVSRISTDSLAAVGLSGVMFFAVLMLFRGMANSTIVFVGRDFGEGDDAKIGRDIWRVLNMVGWASLLVFAFPSLFSWLMSVAAPPDSPTVQALGTTYLQIRGFEIPFVMFSTVVWGFLVGRGDSRTPAILAWVTVLLNIFLDWVLVLGNLGFPELGVAGAAYATLMANMINAGLSATILWSRKSRSQFGTGKVTLASPSEIWGVLKVGLPMGVGDFIEIASFSMFFALLARLGTEILAANQIALQYMSISFTFGIAVGMATSSLVAQFLGAKEPDMAEKVAYRAVVLAALGMGLIGICYLIAPEWLMSIYSGEEKVIAAGVIVLQLIALYQFVDAVGIIFASALNGAGDTTFTMISKSVLAWCFFIPLSWFLLFRMETGIGGAWAGALTYLGLLSLVYFLRWRSGRWKTIELT